MHVSRQINAQQEASNCWRECELWDADRITSRSYENGCKNNDKKRLNLNNYLPLETQQRIGVNDTQCPPRDECVFAFPLDSRLGPKPRKVLMLTSGSGGWMNGRSCRRALLWSFFVHAKNEMRLMRCGFINAAPSLSPSCRQSKTTFQN